MQKSDAIQVFGSVAHLARAIGVSHTAVQKWPDMLPRRLEDRVIAAAVREQSREKLLAVMALMSPTPTVPEPDDSVDVDIGPTDTVMDILIEESSDSDPVRDAMLSDES